MKNKICVLTILILISLFITQLKSNTLACLDAAYWVTEYNDNNASTHQILRRCPNCGQVMNGTAGQTENHFAYYYADQKDGTHNAVCKCGRIISRNATHTWSNYVQISSTQCQRRCTATSCGATQTVNHSYVNGKCQYCGASDSSKMVSGKPTSSTPLYYKLVNTYSKAITVNIDVFGPKVFSSTSNPARKISFTDTVPAGTTRYYFVYTKGTSDTDTAHRILRFGYKDSTETTGHTLALVAQDYKDNGSNINFAVNGNSTYNITFGNVLETWTSTTATGSTISHQPALPASTNNYIYTASDSSNREYWYGGVRANTNVTVGTHVDTSLPYGQVSLSYEIPHEHSWGAWATTTAATCTTAGVQTRTCSGCSQKETQAISALEHSYTLACPTCKEANVKCSRCGVLVTSHTCTIATPSVTLKANGSTYSGAWTNQSVVATLSAANATSYQYSNDGTNWLTASSLSMSGTTGTITFSGDRNNTVYFRSVLTSSIVSSKTAGSVIKIDKTAPTVTLSSSSVIAGTTVTATLSDTASGVNGWQVTKSSTSPTSGWTSITATTSTKVTYTPSSAGTYYVWTKDAAGNVKSATLTVSQVPVPTVALKVNGSTYSGAWTNQNVIATLSATNATSYQYSTDGTNWLTASSLSMSGTTGTITFSGDRNNTVYFRTVVTSSIVSNKTSGSTIKIDKTSPAVTLSSSSVTAGTAVTITLSDAASGVNGWQVTTSSSASTSGWTSITATASTKVTYTPSSVGTYYVWVRDAAGNMKFTTLAVGQATPPTITMGQISTSNINWEGWLLQGDAYVDSEGNLVCSSANSGAYKWFLVDGNKWTVELSYMVTTTGDKQGAYMNSAYFTDTFAAATAQNSYTGNGWSSSATTSYKTSQWTGWDGYGPDVKYVRIYIGYNTTHTSVPVKYKPPKFSSGIEENYVGVRIVATANSGSLSSLKYLWSKSTSGVTESQITNVTSTNQVVYPPYGAKGTYCLWVLAQNSNGGKAITKTDTYTIDNPEIELSLGGNAGKATRYVNAYIFNQENLLTNPSVRVVTKGATTSESYSSGPVGSVESATTSYYGSKAFLLKKTGTNQQWHGIQSAHDFFGNLAANTYVVVSSNYNTTAAAGQTYFTANALYNSSWKSACSQTAVSRQNRIYADGKTHHTHDIIKTNAAITESTSIIGSGMPDWGYSNQVGTMTVDGIQWFVITDFNDGISVKKYAYGDKEITYFRNGGTTFTGNGFTATQNGIYTVYTITDNGVERVRTIEVTGIDKAQPDTTITNSGSSVSTDPEFASGLNGLKTYNNASNGKVSITRVAYPDAPNTSGYVMHIKTNGEASPGHGGFSFSHVPTADQQYVIKLVAKIPTGYSINFATNSIGSHTAKWMTPITGTGDWETYLFYVKAGSTGTFSSTNYFYLTGGSTATESAPVEWDIAYANAYSTTAIAWTNKNVTITGKTQDTGDGIVAYGFNYSDVSSANVTAPTSWTTITATTSEVSATTTADKNGAYYFFAKDANGNISKTATYVERIDKVSHVAGTMTMKLGSSTGSDYTSGIRTKENVYISLVNGSDALSGHKSTTYQVTGANTVAAGTTAATTLTNNGVSTIIVTTTDNAGNTASRTYTVIIAGDPILMSETKENVETNKYILGNSTITQRREDISIISIEDSVPDTLPSGAWDVSKNKDKSVYAWLTVNANNSAKYDLHIAGYGSVIASRGEYLFANYTNCTEIQGLSNLNTAIVANMASMFYGCSSLTSLDLSSFNTSNVTNMNSMFYGCSGLTSLDLKNFDTTNVTTIGAMFHECTGLTSLDVSSFNTSNVTNMDGTFYKCSGLKSFDLANFDTSKVTDMSWMFAWCGGVKQFNLSNFNTTNVTNMRYMFEGCSSLLDIDLSNFSTSKVTNMAGMFMLCYSLKSLPTGLDLINTGITTNTSTSSGYAQMFRSCTSLTSITVNSKYIGYQMFSGCNKVTDITITSNVQGVYGTGTSFAYTGDGLLKTNLNSSSTAITENNYNWITDKRIVGEPILMEETHANAVTNGYILGNSTITQRRADIAIISIEDTLPDTLPDGAWDVSKNGNGAVQAWLTTNTNDSTKYDLHIAGHGSVIASNGNNLFAHYTNCTEIQGLTKLDTSKVTGMSGMFSACNITSLDLSNFDTSNVTYMHWMFSDCKNLTSLDLSNFNTSNVTYMHYMFYKCSGLTSLNLGDNFDTSKVTNMAWMFYNCSSLRSLDVSNFDTSNVTDMSFMFDACRSLTSLDISNFNTSKVTDMHWMFAYCDRLTSVNLNEFDTGKVTNMAYMFFKCFALKSIPTGLDLSNTAITLNDSVEKGYARMFEECTSLTSATINSKYIGYRMFYGCNKLTDITITSNVQGVYNEGTGTPSGAFEYTGDGLLKTTLNSSSSVITKYNYDWTTDKREFNVVETDPSFFDQIVIDTTAPTISDIIITSDGYKVTITATIEDPKASSEIDGIGVDVSATRYAVTQTNTQPAESSSDWKTSNVVTTSFYGTGYVWILAKDALGNTRVASATTKIVIKNYKDSDNNYYSTLADAFSSAATGTTITVLQNTTDSALATLTAKTMTLDLNGKTITKTGSGIAVASSSKLTITDNAGTAGKIVSTVSAISNLITNKGYLTIVNGTISGVGTSTIYSEGTLTLGTLDGEVSITVPTIQGGEYAVNAVNGFNFYDGILKGTTVAYSGDIVDIETGYDKVSGTEGSYKTAYIAIVDRLAPVGTIALAGTYYTKDNDDYVNTNTVTINLTATDNISSQDNIKVALINENNYDKTKSNSEITWQNFSTTKMWQSSSGDGRKRVYVIFKDEAGNQTVYFAE